MAQFGLNVSSSQLEKLKKALNNTDTSKLESTQLTGNAASIFAELNVNSDNAFKNTGLDKILNEIAGDDGKISQTEMQDFLGDDIFSMETFVSVVENAVDEALKDIDTDTTSASANGKNNKAEDIDDNENSNLNRITTKNYTEGDIKSRTVEKDSNGNIISKTYVKADGSTVINKYDENGFKISQETVYEDGTKTYTELKNDENGNKIGAATSRYDSNGNLQSITEADYDAKTGQKTHVKKTDPDGEVLVEAEYKIQKNSDGSYSELRYQIGQDGSKTLTKTTSYSKDGIPKSAINHFDNSVETFNTDSDGKVVSSTIKSSDGKCLSEKQYDEDGNILKQIKYTSDGQIAAETIYTYYENGEVKSEDTKVYIEETKETEALQATVSSPNYMSSASASNSSSSGNGLGLTGEELVNVAKQMLNQYGETHNLCATGVSRTFEMAYGISLHGNGCDWADNMDNLVSQGAFKEVTGDYATSADLANLPAGAVVCWDATGADTPAGQYGHVAIADGNGGEISDHYRASIYKSVGGRSNTYRVYIPV